MGTKREQFQHWLDEWRDYAWSCQNAGERPRLQFTVTDVRDRARQVLDRDEVIGLTGLTAVAGALTKQRTRLSRCQVFLGREMTALRGAGGTWADIAAWTMISDSTVRTLVKAHESRPAPAESGFDYELAELADRVPANPFRRICELTAAWEFHSRVADVLEDLADRVCCELDQAGVARSQIARHAGISAGTLAKRIDRASAVL